MQPLPENVPIDALLCVAVSLKRQGTTHNIEVDATGGPKVDRVFVLPGLRAKECRRPFEPKGQHRVYLVGDALRGLVQLVDGTNWPRRLR